MLTEDDLANFFETHDFDSNEPDDDLTINIIRAVTMKGMVFPAPVPAMTMLSRPKRMA